jgi:uncharacterized protein (DUF305 family)
MADDDGVGMYARFAGALVASLVAMYGLAFSQIDILRHFQWSLSILWISLSMIAAMGLIMLAAMLNMLPNRTWNIALFAGFTLLLVVAITASRFEAFVGDDAFLRSMIPHHSRAIHMCQEAELADQEIIELCDSIIETQREEIRQMESIIERRG